MPCSILWSTSCKRRELWKCHVNVNVQRGLLRAMVRAKNIRNGMQNDNNILTSEVKKFVGSVTSMNPTLLGVDEKREVHDRCLRCGRKLSNIEYKIIGYGPVCLEKLKVTSAKKLF